MGWTQHIEYDPLELSVTNGPRVVTKKIWDGTKWIPRVQYRVNGLLNDEQKKWLTEQFGPRKQRWDYSDAGMFFVMDEQIYMWYQMKWINK